MVSKFGISFSWGLVSGANCAFNGETNILEHKNHYQLKSGTSAVHHPPTHDFGVQAVNFPGDDLKHFLWKVPNKNASDPKHPKQKSRLGAHIRGIFTQEDLQPRKPTDIMLMNPMIDHGNLRAPQKFPPAAENKGLLQSGIINHLLVPKKKGPCFFQRGLRFL